MNCIVIADSDFRTRQALTLLLERKLVDVCVSEAWDRASLDCQLASLHPHVVLLDCHLPGMSLADIAALPARFNRVRLALMSVNADDITLGNRLNAAFIYKGALPDEVLDTIKGLLQQ